MRREGSGSWCDLAVAVAEDDPVRVIVAEGDDDARASIADALEDNGCVVCGERG